MSDLALWDEYVALVQERIALRDQLGEALDALREAADYTRHPDYDWPVEFDRRVSVILAKAGGTTLGERPVQEGIE